MTFKDAPGPFCLSVSALTVQTGDKRHVNRLSLDVPAGESVALVGPVHSGKSALLWSINRLVEEVPGVSVSGEITVAGTDIGQIPIPLLRQRVGLPIVSPLAHTPLAEVGLPLRGMPSREIEERVEQALRLVGLWRTLRDRLHDPYDRDDPVLVLHLVLARTMVGRPGLLLLDDPTRGLDSLGRARFEEAVAAVRQRGGTTILWATREPDQAGRVAATMALMLSGEIVEMGAAERVFERPQDERTESFLTGDHKRLATLTGSMSKQPQSGGRDS